MPFPVSVFTRQVFTGPPENVRDHVIAAAKRLMEGDWKRCSDLILGYAKVILEFAKP